MQGDGVDLSACLHRVDNHEDTVHTLSSPRTHKLQVSGGVWTLMRKFFYKPAVLSKVGWLMRC